MEIKIKPPLISIIIVSYNDKTGLQRCLESIYRYQTNIDLFEIIVIDNHSTDGSVEIIETAYPQIMLLKNRRNAGFSRAINQGIKRSKGAYLLVLNPDTKFTGPLLDRFLIKAEEHKETGIWGPKILDQDRVPIQSCWRFPTIWSQVGEIFYFRWLQNVYPSSQLSHPAFEPDILSGAALFIKREVINILGGFDEQFFWMEDADFCMRATQRGIKKRFCEDVELIHYGGISASQFSTIAIANQIYSKIKFFKKHSHPAMVTMVFLLQMIHVSYKLILFTFLAPVKKTYRKKAWAYFYTLFHFHKALDRQPVLFN